MTLTLFLLPALSLSLFFSTTWERQAHYPESMQRTDIDTDSQKDPYITSYCYTDVLYVFSTYILIYTESLGKSKKFIQVDYYIN